MGNLWDMGALRHVELPEPGLRRIRRGKGFQYTDATGRPVSDADRERIRNLVIPPAWADVWICQDADGHLQATGRDGAGRLQYRYHPKWQRRSGKSKYRRAAELGSTIHKLRLRLRRTLRHSADDKERLLALAVLLMDKAHLRIGSPDYAAKNGSYGLTTILCRHCTVTEHAVVLEFTGKSAQNWHVEISDPLLVSKLTELLKRPPAEPLLAWHSPSGMQTLAPEEVNAFIKSSAGQRFRAKDFRTWHGTMAAARFLAAAEVGSEKALPAAFRAVAGELHNTPAIASGSYVDPRVIDAFQAGELAGVKVSDDVISTIVQARKPRRIQPKRRS